MIIDGFGGPGGWDEGLRLLGRGDVVGIEMDSAACLTRAAAGHATIRADVSRFPLGQLVGKVEGVVMSPPCPTFSTAGQGAGRRVEAELRAAMDDAVAGRARLARHRANMARVLRADRLVKTKMTRAQRSAWAVAMAAEASLIVQPVRWAQAIRPTWIALEQVPLAVDLFRHIARCLERLGYRTWVGILNAADWGVPQTRRRTILMAHLERPVGPPEPTHCRGGSDTLFGQLAPWVSMAAALGWGMTERPSTTVQATSADGGGPRPLDGGSEAREIMRRAQEAGRFIHPDATVAPQRGKGMIERYGERPGRPVSEPAPTIRGGSGGGCGTNLVVTTGANSMKHNRKVEDAEPYERSVDEPAPTLDTKVNRWSVNTGRDWKPGGSREDAQTFDPADGPAPALTAKSGEQWILNPAAGQPGVRHPTVRSVEEPAPTIAFGNDMASWQWERPATVVAGDPRVFRPGRQPDATDVDRVAGRSEGAVKIEVWEALVLQGFDRDYPLQGTRTAQFRQCGDAFPPPVAAAVLERLLK